MALDPEEVYWAMEAAYRNGVLDRFMEIQGEALEGVIEETGLNMGDLLNRMDEASEETVQKIDRMLERAGPFFKYLKNDRMLSLAARLLDKPAVRRMMVNNMKKSLKRTVTGEAPPPLSVRIKSSLTGRGLLNTGEEG